MKRILGGWLLVASLLLLTHHAVVGQSPTESPANELELAAHAGGSGVTSLAAQGSIVALGYPFRVILLDNSLPVGANQLAELKLEDLPAALQFDGDRLYATGLSDGLVIIDVSDPREPVIEHRLDIAGARDVRILNDHAYVAGAEGLTVVDLTGTEPRRLSTLATPQPLQYLDVSGTVAVATAGSWVYRIDLSDPRDPLLEDSLHSIHQKYEVLIEGRYVYTAESWSIQVLELDDDGSLSPRYEILAEDRQMVSLALSDGRLYATDWFEGLLVYDVSDPPKASLVAELPGESTLQDLAFSEGRLLAAQVNSDGMLRFDLRNADQPTLVDSFSLEPGSSWGWEARRILRDGQQILVHAYGTDELYDASDFPTLETVAVPESVISQSADLIAADGRLYVASSRSIKLLVPNGADFVEASRISFEPPDQYDCYDVHDGRIYALTRSNQLLIIDARDPTKPVESSRSSVASRALGDVSGITVGAEGLALVALSDADRAGNKRKGIAVMDVSDAQQPAEPSFIPLDGHVNDMVLRGSTAFVTQDEDLWVIDLSDPGEPQVQAKHAMGQRVGEIDFDRDQLMVVAGGWAFHMKWLGGGDFKTIFAFRCRGGEACHSPIWVKDHLLVANRRMGLVAARIPEMFPASPLFLPRLLR